MYSFFSCCGRCVYPRVGVCRFHRHSARPALQRRSKMQCITARIHTAHARVVCAELQRMRSARCVTGSGESLGPTESVT